jgi:hypothetical protein
MVRTHHSHLGFYARVARIARIRIGGAPISGSPIGSHRISGAAPAAGSGRLTSRAALTGCILALAAGVGCESGGVGDPCTPEDEFFDNFSGFSVGEVNVESRSFQCETRVCLVNKFQGRVSCPYGTNGTPPDPTAVPTVLHNLPCEVPQFGGYVTVPVEAQLTARSPDVSVYCSCRCGGADPNARYCECPSGFECTEIVASRSNQNTGQEQLAGSYCVRSGSNVDVVDILPDECSIPSNPASPGTGELTCGNPPPAVVGGS